MPQICVYIRLFLTGSCSSSRHICYGTGMHMFYNLHSGLCIRVKLSLVFCRKDLCEAKHDIGVCAEILSQTICFGLKRMGCFVGEGVKQNLTPQNGLKVHPCGIQAKGLCDYEATKSCFYM